MMNASRQKFGKSQYIYMMRRIHDERVLAEILKSHFSSRFARWVEGLGFRA